MINFQWLCHDDLLRLACPSTTKALNQQLKGFILDARWKTECERIYKSLFKSSEQYAPHDGFCAAGGTFADVKLAGKNHAYLSHDEYLAAKTFNTIYPIYVEGDGEFILNSIIDFTTAKEEKILQLFPTGKWQVSKITQKEEPPWSLDLEILRNRFGAVLLPF